MGMVLGQQFCRTTSVTLESKRIPVHLIKRGMKCRRRLKSFSAHLWFLRCSISYGLSLHIARLRVERKWDLLEFVKQFRDMTTEEKVSSFNGVVALGGSKECLVLVRL